MVLLDKTIRLCFLPSIRRARGDTRKLRDSDTLIERRPQTFDPGVAIHDG
jgi:hypothetical protein